MSLSRRNYEKEAISFLEEYRESTGNGIGPPVPVELLVESLSDFDILYASDGLSEDESGRIDFGQRLITIRSDESEQRQRFSLAHEAGHLRLHAKTVELLNVPIPGLFGDTTRPHMSRRSSKDWHEVEANRFAAALLMPISLLRPALEQAREKFKQSSKLPNKKLELVQSYLAAQFNVSFTAMVIRLKSTGLSSELFTPRLF